jgi:hypothetical protein
MLMRALIPSFQTTDPSTSLDQPGMEVPSKDLQERFVKSPIRVFNECESSIHYSQFEALSSLDAQRNWKILWVGQRKHIQCQRCFSEHRMSEELDRDWDKLKDEFNDLPCKPGNSNELMSWLGRTRDLIALSLEFLENTYCRKQ